MGGFISLEICYLLAEEESPSIRVTGLILIDSVFYQATRDSTVKTKEYMGLPGGSQPAIREKIAKCMANSRAMIKVWQAPKWQGARPPPAVLIRAREPIPVEPEEGKEGIICDTDLSRDKPKLGWEQYETNFIVRVLDTDGHHSSIFEDKNVSTTSPSLRFYFLMRLQLESLNKQVALALRRLDTVFD